MSELTVCAPEVLEKVLMKTKQGLETVFGEKLKSVILYGSYARGDQNEESDVDVMALVEIPKEDIPKFRDDVIDFCTDINLEYDVLVSINIQDDYTFYKYENSMPYFQNVIREGIRVE